HEVVLCVSKHGSMSLSFCHGDLWTLVTLFMVMIFSWLGLFSGSSALTSWTPQLTLGAYECPVDRNASLVAWATLNDSPAFFSEGFRSSGHSRLFSLHARSPVINAARGDSAPRGRQNVPRDS